MSGKKEDFVADDIASLLRLLHCRSLVDLGEHIAGTLNLLVYDVEVIPYDEYGEPAIEIRMDGRRGTGLRFPVDLDDLWEVADDLETELSFDDNCRWLGQEIALVEGFPVDVAIDYHCDERLVRPDVHRRELSSCFVVQELTEYPYQRKMGGTASIQDWIAGRFLKHYYGLRVEMPDKAKRLPLTTSLTDLREVWRS